MAAGHRSAMWLGGGIVGLGALALGFWAWGIRVAPAPLSETSGTLRRDSVEVAGRQRHFTFYLPPDLQPHPSLLLVLHGSSMDGARMRRLTGHAFDAIADREGVLVVYPDGYGGSWNDCRSVGEFESRRLGIDDVAFARALIGWFARDYGIASDRVFAAGLSNGGQLAYRLALEAPDLVRGIAVVAAGLPAARNRPCTASGRPVATMIIAGTADPLNPYGGGEVRLFGMLHKRGMVESAEATANYWAGLAGAAAEPAPGRIPDADPRDGTTATRRVWSGEGRPEVVLISVQGGGHSLPHPRVSFPRILGRTSHDFSGAEEIWRFFRRVQSDTVTAGSGG